MKKIVFLSLRGLGDSTILASFLRKINPNFSLLKVVTWNNHEPIFRTISSEIEIVKIRQHKFFNTIFTFFCAITILRRYREYAIVNLYGDLIQSALTFFSNSEIKICPKWAPNHAFRKLLRHIPFSFNESIFIDISTKNVYEIHSIILSAVFPDLRVREALELRSIISSPRIKKSNVAIMIGAADNSRQWPIDKWIHLFQLFKINYIDFTIYLDHNNTNALLNFKEFSSNIKCLTLVELLESLKNHSVGVGLDSFSSHLYEYLGIRSVLIYGSNSPDYFKPPNAIALSSSGGCNCYPCYNRPLCISEKSEFACIKSIEPDLVFFELSKLL
jgi:ADP-heptose:LPS heptosyltransferase